MMRKDDLKLEQLLVDPLIRLVMASDGVRDEDLRKFVRRPDSRPGGVFDRTRALEACCT
jgi:hypothetical protein